MTPEKIASVHAVILAVLVLVLALVASPLPSAGATGQPQEDPPRVTQIPVTDNLFWRESLAPVRSEAAPVAPSPRSKKREAAKLRQRLVRVNRGLLETLRRRAGRPAGGLLRLALSDNLTVTTVIDRTGPTSAGYWLAGRLEAPNPGDLTLVVNGEVIAGTVRTLARLYKIRTVDAGVLSIRAVDPSEQLRDAPWFMGAPAPAEQPLAEPTSVRALQPIRIPRSRTGPSVALQVRGGAEDGARIDFLSVYTPTATELYGGEDKIRAEIDLAVAELNQAYANSGVIQRINLVYAAEVDYVPHPQGRVNLERLRDPNDGYLDDVHTMRDRYAADIVTLEPGGLHIQGGAYPAVGGPVGGPATGFADRAFSSHGIGGYAFAHEFGHIQGLSHDRYETRDAGYDLRKLVPSSLQRRICKPGCLRTRRAIWQGVAYDYGVRYATGLK